MDLSFLKQLLKKIYRFYRFDSPWYLTLSFIVALVIFWMDLALFSEEPQWRSILAFGGLVFIYLSQYQQCVSPGKPRHRRQPGFYFSFLTFQICLWGLLLLWVVRH